jgi:hypothetical protein
LLIILTGRINNQIKLTFSTVLANWFIDQYDSYWVWM